MLCEKIIGNVHDEEFKNCEIDYVEIEWHEAYKKLHKKTTKNNRELGIRLGNEILTRGLREGDVLGCEGETIIVVCIPPCEVIKISADSHHPASVAKVCYEIGNRHASLFWGETENIFITPYNEPMMVMLEKIHGVKVCREAVKLDFSKSISSSVNNHTH